MLFAVGKAIDQGTELNSTIWLYSYKKNLWSSFSHCFLRVPDTTSETLASACFIETVSIQDGLCSHEQNQAVLLLIIIKAIRLLYT